MEPEYEGFCGACNGYSEHLRGRIVRNNITGTIQYRRLCPECINRFHIGVMVDKGGTTCSEFEEGDGE